MGSHIVGSGTAMSCSPICLHNVTLAYDRQPVVQRITGRFEAGTLTAIAGPNGAGKSTLLKALVGELAPSEGTVERGGLLVRNLGYLPQAAAIDRHFPVTVSDMVALGAWQTMGSFRGITQTLADRAQEALAAVGLARFGARPISALSVGQFQRVLFARLLLQDARVMVLDEPFAAIDARTTRDLLDLIQRWHGEGRTVIAVLHDFNQVREHFPHTLLLAREMIAWGPTENVLSPRNLQRARTMSESWIEQQETMVLGKFA